MILAVLVAAAVIHWWPHQGSKTTNNRGQRDTRIPVVAAPAVTKDMPVYLGLSGSDTRKMARALPRSAGWGVDGYLVACPYYVRPSQSGLVAHFSALADGTAQRSRWVAEILTLTPGERDKGYAVQQVFLAPNGGRKAEPRVLPDEYRDLAAWGFALEEFYGQSEAAS